MEYNTVYTPNKYRETEGRNGDYAKTGYVIPYPEMQKARITRAQGGSRAKMPYFFAFSKNGRASNQKCASKNNSTMNKICSKFEGRAIKPIKFNFEEIQNFNYKMLLKPIGTNCNQDIAIEFRKLCKDVDNNTIILLMQKETENFEALRRKEKIMKARLEVKRILINKFKDIDLIYNSIVIDLFAGKNIESECNKSAFWDIFGEEAFNALTYNLENSYLCETVGCNMLVPNWDEFHAHQEEDSTHKICAWCNNIFDIEGRSGRKEVTCESCRKEYKYKLKNEWKARQRESRVEYVLANNVQNP